MSTSIFLRVFLVSCLTVELLLTGVATSAVTVTRGKRSDDAGPLEAVVDNLSQQVNSLTAQLTAVNSKLTALETKTASLDQTVAFHAWSDHHIHTAGKSPIIFNHAATNIGHAFDTLTGVFTAPVSGLYDFQASFMDLHRTLDLTVRAAIYVDNRVQAISISDSQNGQYDHGTMRAVVHVVAGQRVYLKNPDSQDHDYYDAGDLPYTTFSGFLIRAD